MKSQKRLTSPRASYAMVIGVWLVYTIAYIARNTYSASIVTLTSQSLLTQSQAGLIGTCYFICYGTGHLINGILADRISPFAMIISGLLGTTAANVLMTAVTPNFALMLIVWSANGFLQAMLWSPIIHIVSGQIAPSTRDRGMVILSTSVPLGTVLAYFITSRCAARGFSWTVPYFIAAGGAVAACAAFSVIAFLTFRRVKTFAAGESAVASAEFVAIPGKKSLLAFLAASGTLVFLIPVVMHGMLKDGIMTWVPSMLKDAYGTTESRSILLAVLLPIANLFGSLISNTLFFRVFRKNHAATGAFIMIVAAIPTALVINTGSLPIAVSIVCLASLSMLMAGFNYLFSTLVPSKFAVYGRASTVSGIFNSAIYAGSAISIYAFGAVAEHFSWSATVAIWLALTVISAVVLAILVKPWRRFLDTIPESK